MRGEEHDEDGAMILLAPGIAPAITAAAREAFPREACGLLLGRRAGTALRVARMLPADNVAADPFTGFELDPAVRFRVERERRDGGDDLLGHWHSHPTGRAEPSATDRAMQYEPELVWLICGIQADGATRLTAWQPDGAGDFTAREWRESEA